MDKIALFTSHYSFGRSILTLEKKNSSKDTGPDSIIDLALKHDIKDVYLIEDNLSSFIEAYENSAAAGLNLRYGLRLTMTNDASKKDEESLKSNHKLIIFALNTAGWYKLCSIYSKAACDFKYYEPRMDYKTLKELWSADLGAAVPFYDSFLYNNNLLGNNCIPDLFFDPVFFLENNDLPMDETMRGIVQDFCFSNNEPKIQETQTIYYNRYSDFKAYNVFRCIDKRSTLAKPNLENFCSNTFCLEHYLENE